MPGTVPLPSGVFDDGTGAAGYGQFWGSTDHSVSGSPQHGGHDLMNDQGLTGAADVNVAGASGSTHLYVGTLVLLALAGIILFHIAGFRFGVTASAGKS